MILKQVLNKLNLWLAHLIPVGYDTYTHHLLLSRSHILTGIAFIIFHENMHQEMNMINHNLMAFLHTQNFSPPLYPPQDPRYGN